MPLMARSIFFSSLFSSLIFVTAAEVLLAREEDVGGAVAVPRTRRSIQTMLFLSRGLPRMAVLNVLGIN